MKQLKFGWECALLVFGVVLGGGVGLLLVVKLFMLVAPI